MIGIPVLVEDQIAIIIHYSDGKVVVQGKENFGIFPLEACSPILPAPLSPEQANLLQTAVPPMLNFTVSEIQTIWTRAVIIHKPGMKFDQCMRLAIDSLVHEGVLKGARHGPEPKDERGKV